MSVSEVQPLQAAVEIHCGNKRCGRELSISDETRQDLVRASEEIWLLCPACSYYTIFRDGKPVDTEPARTNAMWGETWY